MTNMPNPAIECICVRELNELKKLVGEWNIPPKFDEGSFWGRKTDVTSPKSPAYARITPFRRYDQLRNGCRSYCKRCTRRVHRYLIPKRYFRCMEIIHLRLMWEGWFHPDSRRITNSNQPYPSILVTPPDPVVCLNFPYMKLMQLYSEQGF